MQHDVNMCWLGSSLIDPEVLKALHSHQSLPGPACPTCPQPDLCHLRDPVKQHIPVIDGIANQLFGKVGNAGDMFKIC